MANTNEKLNLILDMQDGFSGTLDKYDDKLDKVAKSSDKATVSTSKFKQITGKAGKGVSASIPIMAKGALALGAVATATFALVSARNTDIDNMAKQAITYGESIEVMSAYNYVAEKNKTTTETIGETFKKITEDLGAVALTGDYASTNFAKLGVSVQGANGDLLSANEIFLNSIDALNAIENPTERASKATQVFGEKAGELAPLINEGTDAIKKQMSEANKMGGVYTSNDAKQAEIYNDALLKVTTQLGGLAKQLTVSLSPAISFMLDYATEAITIYDDWGTSIMNVVDSMSDLTIGANELEGVEKGAVVYVKAWKTLEERIDKAYQAQSNAIEGSKEWNDATTTLNTSMLAQSNIYDKSLKQYGVGEERIREMGSALYDQAIAEDKATEAKEKAIKASKRQAEVETPVVDKSKTVDMGTNDRLEARQAEADRIMDILYQQKSDEYDVELEYLDKKKALTTEMYEMSLSGADLELENLQSNYDEKLKQLEQFGVDSTELTRQFEDDQYSIRDTYDKKSTDAKIQRANTYADMSMAFGELMLKADKKNANAYKLIASDKVIMSGAIGVGKAMEKGWAGVPEALMIGAETATQLITVNQQSFAMGGVVQGSSYTGDKTPINANAGEVVLNKNQQQNFMSLANGSSQGNGGGNNYTINISGNHGSNERQIAQLVRNGIDKLTQTNQPNRMM